MHDNAYDRPISDSGSDYRCNTNAYITTCMCIRIFLYKLHIWAHKEPGEVGFPIEVPSLIFFSRIHIFHTINLTPRIILVNIKV